VSILEGKASCTHGVFSPDNKYVLSNDLDKLNLYKYNPNSNDKNLENIKAGVDKTFNFNKVVRMFCKN
jgi:hypothetical protein